MMYMEQGKTRAEIIAERVLKNWPQGAKTEHHEQRKAMIIAALEEYSSIERKRADIFCDALGELLSKLDQVEIKS